ncbi:MAG TPA: hypothetical protein PKU77_13000 [Ferruginibacter sp.]|nr:hypothetical protein [Ferruginibacter sp.]
MKIEKDKRNHFLVGLLIGLLLPIGLNGVFEFPLLYNILLSSILLLLISYGFELFSLITGWGHHDLMDAVATAAGGAISIAVSAILVNYM